MHQVLILNKLVFLRNWSAISHYHQCVKFLQLLEKKMDVHVDKMSVESERQEWRFFTPASLLFTFLLVQLLRATSRRCLPYSLYQYIGEFLCTFQLVTCVYENGLHLKQYGTVIYAVGLFTLSYGYSLTFDALGNPAATFEQIVKRKITVTNGLIKIILQVIGGLCAYKYITMVWHRMAPTSHHVKRLQGVFAGACDSHLQVDVVTGMICEACAMFVCRSVAGAGIGGKYYYKAVNAMTTVVVVLTGKSTSIKIDDIYPRGPGMKLVQFTILRPNPWSTCILWEV